MTIAGGHGGPNEFSATRDGRVTIPAQLRRAAGIEPGARLVLYLDHGRVVIEERAHLLARIQQEAIEAAATAGFAGSAVDELLDDRRAEVARDTGAPPSGPPAGTSVPAEDGGTP